MIPIIMRQAVFALLAGIVLFSLMMWYSGAVFPAALVSIFGGMIAHGLQLGTGTRHLVTGIRLDLIQIEKARIEIDKAAKDIEKAGLDIERAREELKQFYSRIQRPGPQEIAELGFASEELRGFRSGVRTEQEKKFKKRPF